MQYTHIHSLTILRLRSITKVEIALTAIGVLIFGWPTSNACAQVIPNRAAPGSQQPTTLLTANGVPQINIQTPSAAGVSRNLYSQLDVQSNGIILNNSSKNVQTQQAGWIQGNPWLSSGSARIILNEVNAPSPTYLNGYVEVAGQRAEVVIANPSGISVNGGGFINTSKATLTTGLPIVNAGNLEGYRVQGGNVSINGNGLDLSTTDYSAILARAVQVNAGIWANELKVVTGANQIDASSLNPNTAPVTTNIAGSGEAPSMALDVAQIGGMYAGKIHLVGTELGLGVRNAGVLSASAGNLVLQNNGWLTTIGAIQANGNLQISVQGNITNNGQIFGNHLSMAASSLTNDVEAQSAVKIAPVIAARDRLDLGIKDTLINREHALIYSGGNMFIGGGLDASGNAVGEVSQLNNSSATIEAVGDLSLSSKTLRNTNEHFSTRVDQVSGPSAKSWEVGQFHVDHQTFSYKSVQNEYETKVIGSDPAQILAGGNITLTGDQLINDKSKIIAGAMLSGDLGNLNNIQAMGEHRLTESGTVTTTTHYWQGGLFGRGNYWEEQTTDYKPADVVTSISLPVTYAMDKTSIPYSGSASNLALGSDISNSLYKSNPSLVARYLVETNPVFTNNKLWLSSDYMTHSLDIEPGITQKRLGDGFYEQKLIREQVAEMTGKRYLANYTDDSEEYKALMNGAITFAQTYQLRPGIALTAQQVAQLTSDIVWLEEQSVRLPDGSSQKVLVPKLYLKAQSDDLDGSGALLSGKDIKLNLTGDLTNSGAIDGSKLVSLYAANIHNLSGRVSGGELQIVAQQDLNNFGGSISASADLQVKAGRDINIESTTQNTQSTMGSRTSIDRVAGLYVSSPNGGIGGTLVASAGRDMHIVAGVVSNSSSGVSSLSAGSSLNLSSATISDQLDIVWNADNYRKSSQGSEIGSVVTGGGGVHLQAGNDLTSVASKILAKDALSLHATNRVEVLSGQSSAHLDEAYRQTQSSLLSNTTITTHETQSNSLAIASSLEANTVNINAEDIHIKGSRVIGDTETALTAGQSVTIEAATNTINSSRSRNETSSGFMAGEGIRIGFGNQIQSLESNSASSAAAASTLASAKGNVTIQAGDQYKQVGSDVLTPIGNIDISAKKVDVVEAREISHQTTEQILVRSGLDLGVSSVVSSTLQNANKQIKAASQTGDDRMKLLAASNATANLKMAADALESNAVQVVLGFGQSNGQSYTASQTDTARNSTLQAGGNIHIQASGGGDSSNLTVQGSDVSGREVKLVADNAVNLNAAQNVNMQNSHNENTSSSMGVAALLSSKGESLGVNASVSRGNGDSYGLDITNSNTHIVGAESVTIVSEGDTTLKGATVEGKQVNLNAKGNLNIVSLQDTSTYIEKNQQIGVSGLLGSNLSGSVNVAKVDIQNNLSNVTEQSAIKAGDGGFTVTVQGDTNLLGGAITSTQAAIDAKQNTFQTGGTLSTTNIQNKANYDAASVSTNLSAGNTPLPGQSVSAGQSGIGYGEKNGNLDSITTAGISAIAGDANKRTGDKSQAIAPIFHKDQVKSEIVAQTQITQEFGKLASKVVGDYALTKLNEAITAGDLTAMAQWSEGGSARLALHAMVGGLTAGPSGALGAVSSQSLIEPIAQSIQNADLPLELKHTLIATAGTAVGLVASGGSTAGGVTAFNASENNYLTHNKFKDEIGEFINLKKQRQYEICDIICNSRLAELEILDSLRDEQILPLIAACEKAGRHNCKGEVIAQQFAMVNGFGAESMKRESNAGTLGSPFSFNNCTPTDKGGCSFGPLQIAANTGMMQNFMDILRNNPSEEAQFFYKELQAAGGVAASKEGSPVFVQTWMKLTAKDPQFVQYQIDALVNQNLYPVVEELQKVGIDFEALSRSQKEAIFSATVQHGAGVTAKKIGADNILERAISVAQTNIQPPSFPTYTRQELVYGQVEDQMKAAEVLKANLINQQKDLITTREGFITQREAFITQQLQLERQKNQLLEQGLSAGSNDMERIQSQIQILDNKISKINTLVNEKSEKVNSLSLKVMEQDLYIKEAGQYLKLQAQASMADVEQWLKDFYNQRTQMYPSEAKRYQLELDSLLKQYRQEQLNKSKK